MRQLVNTDDQISRVAGMLTGQVLDPMERISEILFGLIMVLTLTSSLSVAAGDHTAVRTMLIGALGCNLAWGIIDGGLYLMARLSERGRDILTLRGLRKTTDPGSGQRIVAQALPPLVASVVSSEQLEFVRQKLLQTPEPPERPRLTTHDCLGAAGICLLVFLSTFPVVVPFLFLGDLRFALRISNAIAIVMMFMCGYAFGHRAGLRPLRSGLAMVVIGGTMVGLTMALGG
jgi:VIT1/CCC1 family predicted Fe2+/Mn2+ transporter